VWRCIGCGRIELTQPRIDVCQDRKVEFVNAHDYDALVAKTDEIRERMEMFATIVRRLATTTPHAGKWEQSYRALQNQAREILDFSASSAMSA
jgi:hypothetical protein